MAAAPLRRRAPAPQTAPARPAPARGPAPSRRATAPARGIARPAGAAVLDRLLAGRLWIGLVFLLLVGIVFFNVDLLGMNRDIARSAQRSESIQRENARLRGDIARLGSSERIQKVAADSGLVLPAPGEVRYLKPNPGADPRNALSLLKSGPATDGVAQVPSAQPGGSVSATGQATDPATATPAPAATPQAPVTTPQAPLAAHTPATTPTSTQTPVTTQTPTPATTQAGQ